MTTYTNRNGDTIDSTLTHKEALAVLMDKTPAVLDTGWFGYWLHKLAAEASTPRINVRQGFDAVNTMFRTAIDNGRKRPEINVVFADRKFRLYYPRTGSGNLCVKVATRQESSDGRLVFGEMEFVCSVLKDSGNLWQPNHGERGYDYIEQQFFRFLDASPVRFLAECGKGLGWCCYCQKRLEDSRALYNGYGRTCATKWSLPWEPVPQGWDDGMVREGGEAINKQLEHLIPDVLGKRDWYSAEHYLLAADYWEAKDEMEPAKQLRSFVIQHPYAWQRVLV